MADARLVTPNKPVKVLSVRIRRNSSLENIKLKVIKKKEMKEATPEPDGKLTLPRMSEMVNAAILNLDNNKKRKGVSLQSIKKYISDTYQVENITKKGALIRKHIVKSVLSGDFIQIKGQGANGSFKLAPTLKKELEKLSAKSETTDPKVEKIKLPKTAADKAVKFKSKLEKLEEIPNEDLEESPIPHEKEKSEEPEASVDNITKPVKKQGTGKKTKVIKEITAKTKTPIKEKTAKSSIRKQPSKTNETKAISPKKKIPEENLPKSVSSKTSTKAKPETSLKSPKSIKPKAAKKKTTPKKK